MYFICQCTTHLQLLQSRKIKLFKVLSGIENNKYEQESNILLHDSQRIQTTENRNKILLSHRILQARWKIFISHPQSNHRNFNFFNYFQLPARLSSARLRVACGGPFYENNFR